MTSLTLSAKDASTVKADALVVGVTAGPSGARLLGDGLPNGLVTWLGANLAALAVSGKADSVHRVLTTGVSAAGVAAPLVVLTGVGAPQPDGTVTAEALRRAAGAATRSLAGTASVALALPAADAGSVAAIAEGALMGAYAYARYRSAGLPADKQPVRSVTLLTAAARAREVREAAARAQVVADAVAAVRDLVNTAPVDLPPAVFADEAVAAVRDLPVTVTVLDEKKLARGGYGGIIGVGKGSSRPPRLVHLDYAPAKAGAHVALVGKGITFDSGGLSIKPAAGMEAMKSDISGAAAVLHTVVAVARLGLPVRVSGWLALAENMPSGTAQRPSDVLTVRGGKTVEVLNTDAEGRLVLADAIVAAGEAGAQVIIDVATLTGAQMVALGNRVSGLMANDETLRSRLHRLADEAGEQFWPMPLPPELRSSLDSPVADIANIGDRFGGMLTAGLFLAEFVPTKASAGKAVRAGKPSAAAAAGDDAAKDARIPWAHLDIAGPAFNQGSAYGYTPVGGTGVSVRTLLSFVEDVAASGL